MKLFIAIPLLALAIVIGHRVLSAWFTDDIVSVIIGSVFVIWCCFGVSIMMTHKLVRDNDT